MAEHELKTWPAYFEAVVSGAKPFEVRKADRAFSVGDTLHLREWVPGEDVYTGRECLRAVTYVLPGGQWGIAPGIVVLGLDQSAAEARGFARGREMAAAKCETEAEDWRRACIQDGDDPRASSEATVLQNMASDIRAMREA